MQWETNTAYQGFFNPVQKKKVKKQKMSVKPRQNHRRKAALALQLLPRLHSPHALAPNSVRLRRGVYLVKPSTSPSSTSLSSPSHLHPVSAFTTLPSDVHFFVLLSSPCLTAATISLRIPLSALLLLFPQLRFGVLISLRHLPIELVSSQILPPWRLSKRFFVTRLRA